MGKNRLIILMLGGAKRVAMARMIEEACHKRGIEPVIASYELNEREPIASVGKVVKGLRWSDKNVDEHIVKTLHDLGQDGDHFALIPFVDGSIETAARISESMPNIYSPTSAPEKSKALFDKTESARLFEKHQIPVPATIDAKAPKFPLIAKPRKGSASKGIAIVRNHDELSRLNTDEYLLQELIEPAEEYTVDCFAARDGRILAISPRRRLVTTGGEVTRTITTDDPKIKELSKTVIERLNLRGAITLQFIKHPEGDPLLMEINPRLGGGAVCSVHAGADLPGNIVDEATGEDPQPSDRIQPNVEIARYFQEVVFKGDSNRPVS